MIRFNAIIEYDHPCWMSSWVPRWMTALTLRTAMASQRQQKTCSKQLRKQNNFIYNPHRYTSRWKCDDFETKKTKS